MPNPENEAVLYIGGREVPGSDRAFANTISNTGALNKHLNDYNQLIKTSTGKAGAFGSATVTAFEKINAKIMEAGELMQKFVRPRGGTGGRLVTPQTYKDVGKLKVLLKEISETKFGALIAGQALQATTAISGLIEGWDKTITAFEGEINAVDAFDRIRIVAKQAALGVDSLTKAEKTRLAGYEHAITETKKLEIAYEAVGAAAARWATLSDDLNESNRAHAERKILLEEINILLDRARKEQLISGAQQKKISAEFKNAKTEEILTLKNQYKVMVEQAKNLEAIENKLARGGQVSQRVIDYYNSVKGSVSVLNGEYIKGQITLNKYNDQFLELIKNIVLQTTEYQALASHVSVYFGAEKDASNAVRTRNALEEKLRQSLIKTGLAEKEAADIVKNSSVSGYRQLIEIRNKYVLQNKNLYEAIKATILVQEVSSNALFKVRQALRAEYSERSKTIKGIDSYIESRKKEHALAKEQLTSNLIYNQQAATASEIGRQVGNIRLQWKRVLTAAEEVEKSGLTYLEVINENRVILGNLKSQYNDLISDSPFSHLLTGATSYTEQLAILQGELTRLKEGSSDLVLSKIFTDTKLEGDAANAVVKGLIETLSKQVGILKAIEEQQRRIAAIRKAAFGGASGLGGIDKNQAEIAGALIGKLEKLSGVQQKVSAITEFAAKHNLDYGDALKYVQFQAKASKQIIEELARNTKLGSLTIQGEQFEGALKAVQARLEIVDGILSSQAGKDANTDARLQAYEIEKRDLDEIAERLLKSIGLRETEIAIKRAAAGETGTAAAVGITSEVTAVERYVAALSKLTESQYQVGQAAKIAREHGVSLGEMYAQIVAKSTELAAKLSEISGFGNFNNLIAQAKDYEAALRFIIAEEDALKARIEAIGKGGDQTRKKQLEDELSKLGVIKRDTEELIKLEQARGRIQVDQTVQNNVPAALREQAAAAREVAFATKEYEDGWYRAGRAIAEMRERGISLNEFMQSSQAHIAQLRAELEQVGKSVGFETLERDSEGLARQLKIVEGELVKTEARLAELKAVKPFDQTEINELQTYKRRLEQAQGGIKQLTAATSLNENVTKRTTGVWTLFSRILGGGGGSHGGGGIPGFIKDAAGAFTHLNKTIATGLGLVGKLITRYAALFVSSTLVFGIIFKIRQAFERLTETSRAVARVLTVTKGASADMAETWRGVLLDASNKFGVSIQDTTEALYQLLSAGLGNVKAQEALIPVMNLARATLADYGDTAKTVAGIYKVYGDNMSEALTTTEKFAHITDVLGTAFKNSLVELDDLVQGLKFAGAGAAAADLSLEAVTASLSIMNDNMIKAGIAGRSMRTMLITMFTKAEQLREAFGATFMPGDLESYFTVLENIRAKLEDTTSQAAALSEISGIFGRRATPAVIVLAKNVEKLRQDMALFAHHSREAAAEMAQFQLDSLAGEWERLRETVANVVVIGLQPLASALTVALSYLNSFFKWISELNPTIIKLVGGFLAANVAIGLFAVAVNLIQKTGYLKWLNLSNTRLIQNIALTWQATAANAGLAAAVDKVSTAYALREFTSAGAAKEAATNVAAIGAQSKKTAGIFNKLKGVLSRFGVFVGTVLVQIKGFIAGIAGGFVATFLSWAAAIGVVVGAIYLWYKAVQQDIKPELQDFYKELDNTTPYERQNKAISKNIKSLDALYTAKRYNRVIDAEAVANGQRLVDSYQGEVTGIFNIIEALRQEELARKEALKQSQINKAAKDFEESPEGKAIREQIDRYNEVNSIIDESLGLYSEKKAILKSVALEGESLSDTYNRIIKESGELNAHEDAASKARAQQAKQLRDSVIGFEALATSVNEGRTELSLIDTVLDNLIAEGPGLKTFLSYLKDDDPARNVRLIRDELRKEAEAVAELKIKFKDSIESGYKEWLYEKLAAEYENVLATRQAIKTEAELLGIRLEHSRRLTEINQTGIGSESSERARYLNQVKDTEQRINLERLKNLDEIYNREKEQITNLAALKGADVEQDTEGQEKHAELVLELRRKIGESRIKYEKGVNKTILNFIKTERERLEGLEDLYQAAEQKKAAATQARLAEEYNLAQLIRQEEIDRLQGTEKLDEILSQVNKRVKEAQLLARDPATAELAKTSLSDAKNLISQIPREAIQANGKVKVSEEELRDIRVDALKDVQKAAIEVARANESAAASDVARFENDIAGLKDTLTQLETDDGFIKFFESLGKKLGEHQIAAIREAYKNSNLENLIGGGEGQQGVFGQDIEEHFMNAGQHLENSMSRIEDQLKQWKRDGYLTFDFYGMGNVPTDPEAPRRAAQLLDQTGYNIGSRTGGVGSLDIKTLEESMREVFKETGDLNLVNDRLIESQEALRAAIERSGGSGDVLDKALEQVSAPLIKVQQELTGEAAEAAMTLATDALMGSGLNPSIDAFTRATQSLQGLAALLERLNYDADEVNNQRWGGPIGTGYGGGDSLFMRGERGEFMMNKEAHSYFGTPFMNDINNRRLRHPSLSKGGNQPNFNFIITPEALAETKYRNKPQMRKLARRMAEAFASELGKTSAGGVN